MSKVFALFLFFFCNSALASDIAKLPSWFAKPKQNDSQNLYGVAEGFTLEEATKSALADAAARLMVSVSSTSTLTRSEDQNSANEEMTQVVRQNIEKISFTNFEVSRSEQVGPKLFVEAKINRSAFIRDQKERVEFLENQIANLDKNSTNSNPIKRRNALMKISDLGKELELKSRILAGAGEAIDLKKKLALISDFQNQLEKSSDKIEFFFDINSTPEIAKIIRTQLNKEKLKIAPSGNNADPNQVVVKITSAKRENKIYEAFMTKLTIDFENLAEGKVLASNALEVTGSSVISEKEAYFSALKSLEEKIQSDGILKILGIIN
jgi:hypothetical protein